jgi:GTP-binding protein
LFVIDGFAENAYEQFTVLKEELKAFHPKLAKKPYVIALNKSDLGIDEAIKQFKAHKEAVIVTSAVTGDGCKELTLALDEAVPHVQKKKVGWESKSVVAGKTSDSKSGAKTAAKKSASAKTGAAKKTTASKSTGAKSGWSKKKA